jgi:mannitol-1-phosphate 5-dehydrogenase
MNRTFVGFGFGPIQSALFLLEAYRSKRFDRFVVAEVDPALVHAVRDHGGLYTVNIAHKNGIEPVTVEGVTLLNPAVASDRAALVEAIADADEVATALPSIAFYGRGVAQLIGEGLARRASAKPLLIYTAENHNHAAEALNEALVQSVGRLPAGVQCLNTVIGKMSGVITDDATITRLKLATLTPVTDRAVLVEAFNRILISKIAVPGAESAIACFVEKADLLPFEEAKLYGHNAIHALIGYLAHARGLVTMDQASHHDDLMATARTAFVEESGAALCRKYAALGDSLFTAEGFTAYADDLLDRMTNPHLNDLVARVIRDPQRKLGWNDRLYGTMRLAMSQGIEPRHMARGAAAAVRCMNDGATPATRAALDELLRSIWGDAADHEADRLVSLTWEAMR